MGFLKIQFVKKDQKSERGPLKTLKIFRKKASQSRKWGGESLIEPKNIEEGTTLLWNAFVFHVRGVGCLQNEVLNTYGENA